jgi:excinuclease ABC subunit C
MVVFEGGAPKKSDYRRFTIRTVEGSDDYASMAEVLERRFARWDLQADLSPHDPDYDPSFAALPNLVVIDGGKGQLAAALAAMQAFDLPRVAVIALAKREEEVFVPGRARPIVLSRHDPGLQLLQRIRDEAHRFAITYHRAKRSKALAVSQLDDVPGLGPARRATLLRRFGSVRRIAAATPAELALVPGIGPHLADAVLAALRPGPDGNQATGKGTP